MSSHRNKKKLADLSRTAFNRRVTETIQRNLIQPLSLTHDSGLNNPQMDVDTLNSLSDSDSCSLGMLSYVEFSSYNEANFKNPLPGTETYSDDLPPINNILSESKTFSQNLLDFDSLITDEYASEIFDDLDTSEDSEDEPDDEWLRSELAEWSCVSNTPLIHITSLLGILRKRGLNLPKTGQTLLKTPKSRKIIDVPPGQYIHIGVKVGVENLLKKCKVTENPILIDIN